MKGALPLLLLWTASPALADDAPTGDALARIEALEARLAEVEQRLDDPSSDRLPDQGREQRVVVPAGEQVDQAVAFGGPVEVWGTVLGSAVSMGGDVTVRPGGVVRGDAVAFGGRVQVDEGGELVGEPVAFGAATSSAGSADPLAAAYVPVSALGLASGELWSGLHGLLRRVALLLSIAGAGVLVVGLWPRQVGQVGMAAGRHPFWYGVGGAILAIAMSLGAAMLGLTVVGLPVSLVLMLALSTAWMLGIVAICHATGERFAPARRAGGWASFLVGATLLGLLSLLPAVGPLLMVLLSLVALGAGLVTRLGNRADY